MADEATTTRTLRPPVENEVFTERLNRADLIIAPLMRRMVGRGIRAAAKHSPRFGVGSHTPRALQATTAVRVASREAASPDGSVVTLTFERFDRGKLPEWFPGAHLDVMLPSGRRRQYSLCGEPADRSRYRIAVRRIDDGAGGSPDVHALNIGDTVTVSHPRNAFPFAPIGHLDSGDRRIRLVAAGIGITPIITMAEAAHRLGLDWSLAYLGRSLESLAFVERVHRLGARAVVHTDGPLAVADIVGDTRPGTALYICGPGPLIEEAADLTRDADGVEMHFERFTLPPIRDGRPFRVILARSGETIDVPADRTMLDAILDSRPGTVHSCRQGFCGTCRQRVLSGRPEHRDSMLAPNDRADGAILPCISRAADDLVIDL